MSFYRFSSFGAQYIHYRTHDPSPILPLIEDSLVFRMAKPVGSSPLFRLGTAFPCGRWLVRLRLGYKKTVAAGFLGLGLIYLVLQGRIVIRFSYHLFSMGFRHRNISPLRDSHHHRNI